jgi:hypothetical protein
MIRLPLQNIPPSVRFSDYGDSRLCALIRLCTVALVVANTTTGIGKCQTILHEWLKHEIDTFINDDDDDKLSYRNVGRMTPINKERTQTKQKHSPALSDILPSFVFPENGWLHMEKYHLSVGTNQDNCRASRGENKSRFFTKDRHVLQNLYIRLEKIYIDGMIDRLLFLSPCLRELLIYD